jgi:hypothetical protein
MDPAAKASGDSPPRGFADADPSVAESAGQKPTGNAPTPSSLALSPPPWARALERPATVETKRPLQLLDLPVDILRDIIAQVSRPQQL